MAAIDTPVRMLITTPALFAAPPKRIKVVADLEFTDRVYFILNDQLVGVGQPETHKETTR